jgi:serine/threonine-protein kinase RsbW
VSDASCVSEFRARLWATAQRLIPLRRDLARWVEETPLDQERQEDVVLAVYEAMANAAEHAYPDGRGGPLSVTAQCEADELTVIVADEGRWKKPDPGETMRGRGRPLIATLADADDIDSGEGGTTVMMRFRLGSA